MSHGGKGDKRRPRQISIEEEDLRWKLVFAKTEEERAILKQQIKNLMRTENGKEI